MIKLSKTSKLDGILSWSLQAIETCPASKDANGNLIQLVRVVMLPQGTIIILMSKHLGSLIGRIGNEIHGLMTWLRN